MTIYHIYYTSPSPSSQPTNVLETVTEQGVHRRPACIHSLGQNTQPLPIIVVSGPYIIMTLQELERRHLIKHASFCPRIRIRNLTLRPDGF